jgi:Zn-dependent protease
MGWQDRSYYRDRGASSGNPLMWLLTGSVPLFTVFGIRVRMHASMLLLFVLMLATSGTSMGIGVGYTFTFVFVMFGIVLLHEFGHCFAARSVGGDADQVILSPLGGVAFTSAPHRAWPQLVTVAGGPLVNVAICLVTALAMAALNWRNPGIPLNPLSPRFSVPGHVLDYWLWFVFIISWGLLLFNLLPIYPLDGGQMLRAVLWFKLGNYRASMITAVVGMIGAVLMIMVGITRFTSWYGLLLILIGAGCLINCYQLRAMLKAEGPWAFEDDAIDYSASLWKPEDDRKRPRKLSRWTKRRLRKQADAEENEQSRIDAILSKVSARGMQSLTWSERRALRKATERQRRREVEVSRYKS